MEDKRLIPALILFLMFPSLGFSQTLIGTFPQSKIVSQDDTSLIQSFELITGPVKRINSLLSPESVIVLKANKRGSMLLSLKRRNAKEIYQYYLDQLGGNSEIIFQCIGRSCGPSTYWANIIYNKALLYGPEQYQGYIVATMGASQSNYLAIYIGQRATGQVYIQHDVYTPEVLSSDRLSIETTESQIISGLAETGRYVLPKRLNQTLIKQIESVVAKSKFDYLLVVYDKLGEGESFDAALSRAEEIAMRLKKQFSHPQSLSRIRFHGAGPISPLTDTRAERVELIELR